MKNRKCKLQTGNNGFTIVELMVAMSVFVVVATIASGVFVKSIRDENRLIAVMGMQTNLNTSLEQMAREMRGGYLFNALPASPSKDCATDTASGNPAGYSSVEFIGPNGTTTYSLSSGDQIMRSVNGRTTALTSSNVKISNLCFIVSQAELGDQSMYASAGSNSCNPWRVSIFAEAAPEQTSQSIQPFYLQTTVSSRVLPKDMSIGIKSQYGYDACQ